MDESASPLVFLSYASPDRERVLPYYGWLQSQGFSPWIDCKQLLPGQNWDLEICRAIDRAGLVLIFTSRASVTRRSYVQKEIKRALARSAYQLADDIFLVPVSLDDTPIPDELRSVQCISESDPLHKEKILAALKHQLERLGKAVSVAQEKNRLSWASRIVREGWQGIPGYSVEYEYPEFSSTEYPNLGEATDYIRSAVADHVASERYCKLEQNPKRFSSSDPVESRTNICEAHYGAPTFRGRLVTVQYAVHYGPAGAAHPNYSFLTFSYMLNPLVRVANLAQLFEEPTNVWPLVQRLIREQLYAVNLADDPEDEPVRLKTDWIDGGTGSWMDLDAFAFRDSCIEILFAPYRVAPYVCGPQFAEIPYSSVAELLDPKFRDALEL